jgi:hypothetical protein
MLASATLPALLLSVLSSPFTWLPASHPDARIAIAGSRA